MRWETSWNRAKTYLQAPSFINEVREVPWADFEQLVAADSRYFPETFVSSIYRGDAWLLKGALSAQLCTHIRDATVAWTRARPSSFHKMLDGVPDFHRQIDIETGKAYSIRACKHSAYFFRWNDDPLGVWPEITHRWRVLKTAMGLRPTAFEKSKPSDGPTDRIQVVRYPPKIGYLEPHRDAAGHQPCFISGYLSKRGVDYQGGGFYFVDEQGESNYLEDQIEVGDLCLAHANVMHGVAPCDVDKEPDWNATDGRWFLGLYSNASDYEAKRDTSAPVKISIPGVVPEGAK